jgi:nucleoside-triphosphatase THEP1
METYEFSTSFSLGSLLISPVHVRTEQLRPIIAAHRHANTSYEIHYTERGSGSVTIDGVTRRIEPDTLYITGPSVVHAQQSDTADPIHEYCLYLNCRRSAYASEDPFSAFAETLFWMGKDGGRIYPLLRRLIEAKGLDCSGFETQAFYLGGERRGFTLHGRVDMPPYENDCICCARVEAKRSVPVLPVFDENGARMLQASRQVSSPFILMDELGRLERQAHAFIDEIYACLDSDKRVLGVLQKCSSEHVEAISKREDVTVLTVTPENRDALLAYLLTEFN